MSDSSDSSGFDHAAHIRLALDCLVEEPTFAAAADRMSAVLRGKAGAAGHPEKYHHTVTLFWMRMVARMLDKNLPLTYYSAARLSSDAARAGWVEPDLQAIDHAATDSVHSSRDPSDRALPR
jgi:hypothetical protein